MIPSLDERWRVEIKWLDPGGCEHVLSKSVRNRDEVASIVAMAIDVLTALDEITTVEQDDPPSDETVRDLWHWRISWSPPPFTLDHVMQSWSMRADALWRDVSDAIEALLDLREILRQSASRDTPSV